MSDVWVHPVSKLEGEFFVPGDKSLSHRALLFAALSEKKVRIRHLLESEDVFCTMKCLQKLGVRIFKEDKDWVVEGVGLHGLKEPKDLLDCGNSGTTMRLLLGVLAAQPFSATLIGDASLSRRPMKRVIEPLTQMGARFSVENEGLPTRKIHLFGGPLQAIAYQSPIASAQVKSAILLAGLWAKGSTSVTEPSLSRDHTERMLAGFSVPHRREGLSFSIEPVETLLLPDQVEVPGDFSSAAFFIIAALIVPHARLLIRNVGLNPTRTGLLSALKRMGASIQMLQIQSSAGEEQGDLLITGSRLLGTDLSGDEIPRLIDEIPIFSIAAACAEGVSRVSDAEELRTKESDRISVLVGLLSKLGVSVEEKQDGFEMVGPAVFKAGEFESFGDHRMAMMVSIAALVAKDPFKIKNIDCVKTSFPNFWNLLEGLGVRIEAA